jgi:predicted aconitase with swiveling domain
MAGIPMVDQPDAELLNIIHNGDQIVVDANSGFIKY